MPEGIHPLFRDLIESFIKIFYVIYEGAIMIITSQPKVSSADKTDFQY